MRHLTNIYYLFDHPKAFLYLRKNAYKTNVNENYRSLFDFKIHESFFDIQLKIHFSLVPRKMSNTLKKSWPHDNRF